MGVVDCLVTSPHYCVAHRFNNILFGNMEIITSNKGKQKICLDGYMYVLHVECKSFIRWRCAKYSSLKCGSILKTALDNTNPVVDKPHNHPADSENVKVVKCMQTIKAVAENSAAAPAEIFATGVSTLENSTKARMPVEDSAKRTLRNYKTKSKPKTPDVLTDLRIEGEWCTTGNPRLARFLLHDNGPESEERIIIYATDESLQFLASSPAWYMDGNFQLAPRLFQQLYVIRVSTNNIFVTAVYALLQSKSQNTYEDMLRVIMEECASRELYPDPVRIHMDFERPMMQAAKTILGDEIIIQGCFYHLTQSTHRKIQSLGLEVTYRTDEDFNLFCGMLDGLAFLPIQDVRRGMDHIRTIMPEAAVQLVDYFDATYVTGTFRRVGNPNAGPVRLRNIPPMFPPQTWNVHAATLAGTDRTNNQVEGWNNRFSNLIGHNHPSVWTLIKKMQLELAADETKLAQQNLGVISKKKKLKTYENLQNRLHILCEQYVAGEKTLEDFIRAVGHTIRFT